MGDGWGEKAASIKRVQLRKFMRQFLGWNKKVLKEFFLFPLNLLGTTTQIFRSNVKR